MKFGLHSKALDMICRVFKAHPVIKRVQVFGSRAMQKFRDNSDIDLVIYGDIDELLLAKIAAELDELPLPYLFDIKSFSEIQSDELKEHIKIFGKDLYSS